MRETVPETRERDPETPDAVPRAPAVEVPRDPADGEAAPRGIAATARLPAAVAAAWVVVLYAGYQPGMLSPDSHAHLVNGYYGAYGSWHPPLNAWLVGAVAGRLAGSPWPIFLAQLVALAAGLASLSRAPRRSPWTSAALLAIVLALPNVWAIAVTVWKDVFMAAALVWAIALLRADRPVAAVACALVAVLARHNGIFAAAPLAVLAAVQLGARRRASRGRVAATSAAILVLLAVAPRGVERLAHARDDWPLGSLLSFDLAGIYAERPELFPGSVLERELTLDQVRELYTPDNGARLFWNGTGHALDFRKLPERRAALWTEWWSAVRAAPGAYAHHRWRVVAAQLGIGREHVADPFWWDMWPNDWGLSLPKAGAAYQALERIRMASRDTLLFRGWAWLAACCAVGAIGWRLRRLAPLVPWVAASGVIYCLPYLVIGVAGDYRYVYWTTLCALAGALLVPWTAAVRELRRR